MIFKYEQSNFHEHESYKERNLYYKYFAAYYFNELVPGYDKRREKYFLILNHVLNNSEKFKGNIEQARRVIEYFRQEKPFVTFDYHSSQVIDDDKRNDRGEMSDILFWIKKAFISVECKFLSDISFEKDIREVQDRIIKVSSRFDVEPLQILLITKANWEGTYRQRNKESSFYSRFQKADVLVPVLILLWEDLLNVTDDATVKSYLTAQLKR